jgi:hypothetical protein
MLATQVFMLAMGFRVSVCEKLHTVLFLDHMCTIRATEGVRAYP